ncbi:MAG TPA: phospholipid carrier-dependent glycosyltransferase, partial [Vicinamibacteria bacterium]
MAAATPAGTTRPRTGLVLLCAFLGFYLLTASGHFYSGDEETLYLVTESLVERHTFALPDDAWVDHTARGTHGGLYAQYPPGQSLAAVPFYLLGRAVAVAFPPDSRGYVTRFCVALFGSVVAALTVALLYRLARSLGFRAAPSLGLAAIYGVAMPAWPYSRTFFAEPLTALLLLAAFCALRRGSAPTSPGWLVAAGLAAGAAVATKPHGAIALPILGLYLLRRASRPTGEGGGRRAAAARGLRAALWWGAGLAVVAFPYAAFNAAIYGGSLRTGYSQSVVDLTFDTPLLVGLYGLTISPNKGLLWYAPPVLLALAGWWWFARGHVDEAGGWRSPTGQGQHIARGHADEALACLGIALVHLGFYSRHHVWHGDGSWGPRYLTIALPFVALPMVALLDEVRRSRPLAALVALVATAGVAVQLLGVLVNFHWYFLYSNEDARRYSPAASPLLYHARLVARRTHEWYAQTWPPGDTAQLARGFTQSEGMAIDGRQPLFPRWTTGDGQIILHPAAPEPTVVKVTFFDHRPPALRREPARVLVDGAPLDAAVVERHDFSGTGEGWTYQFTVPP